jgi:hypothetical protein
MTNQTWFKTMENGKATPSYWAPVVAQLDYRLALKTEGALLFNKRTTNTNLSIANTQGLIPELRSGRGHLHPTSGAFVLADINDINTFNDSVWADQNQVVLLTGKRMQQIEDEMTANLSNTGTNRAEEAISEILWKGTGNDSQKAFGLNYHISYIEKGGRNFAFAKMMSLDNPSTYNVSTALSKDYAIFFGCGKQKDAKGKLRNHMCLNFKQNGSHSRYMETWTDGAGGPGVKIGDIDKHVVYQRSHIGAQWFKLKQVTLMTN